MAFIYGTNDSGIWFKHYTAIKKQKTNFCSSLASIVIQGILWLLVGFSPSDDIGYLLIEMTLFKSKKRNH